MRDRARKALGWLKSQSRIPLATRLSKGSDLYELAGVGCLVGAAFWWIPIIGLVVLGIALIWLSQVTHESQ